MLGIRRCLFAVNGVPARRRSPFVRIRRVGRCTVPISLFLHGDLMTRFSQAVLLVPLALAFSSSGRADDTGATNDTKLRLPVLSHLWPGVDRPRAQCSRDAKYFAYCSQVTETATGKFTSRSWGWQSGQAFFARGETPREVDFDREREKTSVYDFPGYRPALVIPGKQPLWTMVWKRPLHEAPLLIVPTSEAEGRVELWDLESLKKVLETRDKELYSDVLGPLTTNESLVASQAGNRLAWLDRHGDVHVWNLQGQTAQVAVFPRASGPRSPSLCQILFASPDGSQVAVIEFVRQRIAQPEATADVAVNLIDVSNRSTVRIHGKGLAAIMGGLPRVGVFFAPSGSEIVLAAGGVRDSVFDARTGKFLRSNEPVSASGEGYRSSLSPDLYARANDNRCCFWLLGIGDNHPDRYIWFRHPAHGVSPDGFYFELGSTNGLIEVATGRKIALVGEGGAALNPDWFTPDGRHLLAVDSKGTLQKEGAAPMLDLCRLAGEAANKGSRGQGDWLTDLSSSGATGGQIAVRRLAALGDEIIEPLLDRVRYEAVPAKLEPWIAHLDSDEFSVRQRASRELERFGRLAERQLSGIVAESKSAEAIARAKRILLAMDESAERGETLAQLRALQVLAIIGSDRALEGVRQLKKHALSNRVRELADLTLFRLQFQ